MPDKITDLKGNPIDLHLPIFNDYDENGVRTNIAGCRSTKIEDEAIVHNLRFRWPKVLSYLSDAQLVNEYDTFALSELFGNDDENFLEWLNL